MSYSRPLNVRGLWDADGKQLANFTDAPVTVKATRPPSVTGVAVVSNAGDDATYGLGETIEVEVTFDEAVAVDTGGAAPRLKLDMDPAHKVDWRLATPPPSAPAFDDAEAVTLAIAENHADAAQVGTVAASDADGDALTYSLSGADAAHFTIDAHGAIAVAAGTTLDREAKANYSVTAQVQAELGYGLEGRALWRPFLAAEAIRLCARA